jgi:hypothetical protein
MVDVYSKMKPDSFKLKLQTLLTACYEDITGAQSAGSCSKTKVVKHKFKDQEDTRLILEPEQHSRRTLQQMQMLTPPPPPPSSTGALQQLPAGWSLHRPPALPVVLPPALGARASGWQGPQC